MSEEREWSVVMMGFSGNCFAAAFRPEFVGLEERVFGRRGLDITGMCFFPDKHLPAELADRLPLEEAEKAAAALREVGADVRVVRTDAVRDVRHRAAEVWATRCTETFCFTEVDDLISILGAVNTRDNLVHIQPGTPSWNKELSLNHIHVGLGDEPEEATKKGRQTVDALRAALLQAYPERGFTIAHWLGDEVSFWQTTPDSPREPEDGQELIFVEPVSPLPC